MGTMKIMTRIMLSCALVAVLFVPVLSIGVVAAATATSNDPTSGAKSAICSGIGVASGSCSSGGNSTIDTVLSNVLNLLSLIAGFAGVVMIIISGIRFITAQGDSSGVASARSALTYALVGLVIAALAQVIVHFVLGKITGIK